MDDFVNVARDCKDLSFRQVWEIYDRQFSQLREAIESMGDEFVIEDFSGEGNGTLSLQHSYRPDHVIVYKNSVIQWKDIDYYETDSKTVTMVEPTVESDTIKVIIVVPYMLSAENVYSRVRNLVDESVEAYMTSTGSDPTNPNSLKNQIKNCIVEYLSEPGNWPDNILILKHN